MFVEQPHHFVGRSRELALLDDLNQKPGAKFLVMYGRRRVGKTRLLTHWTDTRDALALYWVASQTSASNLLASFSQALQQFIQPDVEVDHRFTYPTWDMALEQIAVLAQKAAQEGPLVLILDEFTYALQADSSLASVLQNAWDHRLQQTALFLIISGSHVHMMQAQAHSARAPLYGRASARLHLRPLPYGALPRFFPEYEPDALVALYAILGGIPAYLELFDPTASLSENIQHTLLTPHSLLQADALLFLHEQFDEPRNYAAIMEAIAHNSRTRGDIAEYLNLSPNLVGRYLSTLVELGIVERRLPVTTRPTGASRQGRYYLADPYLRFYFRFIAPRLDQIERHRTAQTLAYVRDHLREFVGSHAFEELCRDWVGLVGDQGRLPFYPERVGSYWGSDAQLDVFALNEDDKTALVGECKWGASPVGKNVVDKLARQAPKGISHLRDSHKWTTYLYLFARAGVTDEAAQRAAELNMTVVTLAELDHGLRQDV